MSTTNRSSGYTNYVVAPQTKFPLDYINKTVSLRYFGREHVFHLSHALFSSNDVDAGTRLLLKNIPQRLDASKLNSILDIGCGVGVIGITLAAAAPGAHLMFQDRDALAVAFARENAKVNGVQNADFDCDLAFWNLGERAFDLVVSNLPAKAGRPVLEGFFHIAPDFLSRGGVCAVVIVRPLEQFARDSIQSAGCLIIHAQSAAQHSVFFFQRPESPQTHSKLQVGLTPYLRARHKFSAKGIDYELETAFNLADFDTIGYDTQLAQEILAPSLISGKALFWNPGQGHLSVYAEKKRPGGFTSVRIAGRDILELAISERNLRVAGRSVQAVLLPTEAGLAEALDAGSVNLLCAMFHPVAKAPWQSDLAKSAEVLLPKGGMFLAAGESTEVFRLLDACRSFKLVANKKHYGFRAVLLQRR